MGLFDPNGPIVQCLSRVLCGTSIPDVAFWILLSNKQGICFLGGLSSSNGNQQTIWGWFSVWWGPFLQLAWIMRPYHCKGLVHHLQLLVLLCWDPGAGFFIALLHCLNQEDAGDDLHTRQDLGPSTNGLIQMPVQKGCHRGRVKTCHRMSLTVRLTSIHNPQIEGKFA